jgi:hypothetical protein
LITRLELAPACLAPSFDHLVAACEQRLPNFEPECLGRHDIRAQVEQLFGKLARMRYVAATLAVDELDIEAL